MLKLQNHIEDCRLLRAKSPIIYNITNCVAMNFTANALLATGASPIMSSCPEEAEDLAVLCDALSVNIGTVDAQQLRTMELASAKMQALGKPWVLDPVGAGASHFRTKVSLDLINRLRPTVLRCNSSEAAFLAEAYGIIASAGASRGVDAASQTYDAEILTKALAAKTGTVVCISGKEDFISDGTRLETVSGGASIMSEVTAMGCVHGALCAAFASFIEDPFRAAWNASVLEKTAGQKAAARCYGSGSFVPEFIDALNNYDKL